MSDIDPSRLTLCQRDAAEGLYAQAHAGYIRWLAERYDQVRQAMPGRIAELRAKATKEGQHRRTPDVVAHLAFGFEQFLGFAQGAGALTHEEAKAHWNRAWKALGEAAAAQALDQAAAEPARHFLSLLRASITSGKAYVAGPGGGAPDRPEAWGWRNTPEGWRASGDCVGWVDGEALYLEPGSAYAAAQRMGRDGGEGLSVASRTLHKRLRKEDFLVSTDRERDTLTVRRQLAGARRTVLHLWADSLIPSGVAQPAHAEQDVPQGQAEQGDSGAEPGAGSVEEAVEAAQPSRAESSEPQWDDANGAKGGQVGQVAGGDDPRLSQSGGDASPGGDETIYATFPKESEKAYSQRKLTDRVAVHLDSLGGAPPDNRKFSATQVAALFGVDKRRRKSAQRQLEGYEIKIRAAIPPEAGGES